VVSLRPWWCWCRCGPGWSVEADKVATPPLFTGAGVRELPRDGVTLVLWRDPKVVLGDRSARTPT
jgi:hypothetical protein